MATPQPIAEAGLSLEYQEDGARLIVRDVATGIASSIRNRGGEALALLLSSDRKIRALDMRESNISDTGIAHLALTLRQTDQLEEFLASPVGHAGLEFILGVVRRCGQLKTLSAEVRDVPTLFLGRQNLSPADYDTSGYVAPKSAEDEEPVEDEEEAEAKAAAKALQLRKLFAANDYDSGDEGPVARTAPRRGTGREEEGSASPALAKLLSELVSVVRQRPNLTSVECRGEAVPAEVQLDLSRAAEEHREKQRQKAAEGEEKGSWTAADALQGQMDEICAALKEDGQERMQVDGVLPGEEDSLSPTRLGIRSFVGRRLFSALGEALFECQRFKSKSNPAVATAQGEMAFIAMYLRQQMAAENAAAAP